MATTPIARLGALALATVAAVSAETLHVPQDFSMIQRAVDAAAPGDIVEVAAGTYSGNVSIDKPLTLIGAGSDKTIILARDRSFPALEAQNGKISVRGFALKFIPQDPHATDGGGNGARFAYGDFVASDLRIEQPPNEGILVFGSRITLENSSIVGAPVRGLMVNKTSPDSLFKNLKITPDKGKSALVIEDAMGTFTGLTLTCAEAPVISIFGENAVPKFSDLSAADRKQIDYQSGATAAGPANIPPYERPESNLGPDVAALHDKFGPRRRALTRELETSLRAADSEEKYAAILAGYFKKLTETGDLDITDDELLNTENSELEEFGRKFSALALDKAMAQFAPALGQEESNLWERVSSNLSLAVKETKMADAEREAFQDLPKLLAAWKNQKGTDPRAAADSFIAMLKTVSAKYPSIEDELHEKIVEQIDAQLKRFADIHGVPGLNQLMRRADGQNDLFVNADHLRFMMTDEQRRSLIQWLVTQK